MSCVRPKKIINPKYKGVSGSSLREISQRLFGCDFPPNYYINTSCGNCVECQKKKFIGYRMRLLYELQQYPNSIFVTLTFADEHLMRFSQNPNKALRLFLDRFRKRYGKQVRHWFVAEFGSEKGRLHYHGILFNCDIANDELADLWQYGFTFVGYANEATAKYIVKYLTKQDTKGLLPPRILSSIGIGSGWLSTPEAQLMKKSLSVTMYVGAYPFALPKYYVDKLFTPEEKAIIQYYYYMETPTSDTFVLDGREYSDYRKYKYALNQKYMDYRRRGLLFDGYLSKPKLSSASFYRVHCDYYFNNVLKNF